MNSRLSDAAGRGPVLPRSTIAATGAVGRASATTIGSAAVPRPISTEPLARRASTKYATCSPRRRRRRDRRLEAARRTLLHRQVRERRRRRRPVAQHHRGRIQILVGHDEDRHRLFGLSHPHGFVNQRLLRRQSSPPGVLSPAIASSNAAWMSGFASPGLSRTSGWICSALRKYLTAWSRCLNPPSETIPSVTNVRARIGCWSGRRAPTDRAPRSAAASRSRTRGAGKPRRPCDSAA